MAGQRQMLSYKYLQIHPVTYLQNLYHYIPLLKDLEPTLLNVGNKPFNI